MRNQLNAAMSFYMEDPEISKMHETFKKEKCSGRLGKVEGMREDDHMLNTAVGHGFEKWLFRILL